MTMATKTDIGALANRLLHDYGPLTQVGDDTEDDFGDLLTDAWEELVGGDATADLVLWAHFQDVAVASQCTTYEAWLSELEATVTR